MRILVTGEAPCQLTYRDYLTRILAAMGITPLPDKAFSDAVYATDWRHRLLPLVAPLARLAMLRRSPYYRRR